MTTILCQEALADIFKIVCEYPWINDSGAAHKLRREFPETQNDLSLLRQSGYVFIESKQTYGFTYRPLGIDEKYKTKIMSLNSNNRGLFMGEILSVISKHPGATQKEIKKELKITRNIFSVLRKLLIQDILEVIDHGGKRKKGFTVNTNLLREISDYQDKKANEFIEAIKQKIAGDEEEVNVNFNEDSRIARFEMGRGEEKIMLEICANPVLKYLNL